MIVIEWLAMALVLVALACFSQGWMRRGFYLQVGSTVAWAVVAIHASLWGLLTLQAGIALLAIRGLWRMRK